MNNKLNIAVLSIHSCPYAVLGGKDTGGMNVYIRELSRELLDRGHRIDIFTASHNCGHCNLIPPGVDMKLVHLQNTISAHSSLSGLRQQISSLASEIDFSQELSGYKYDLIHSHYWQSGAVGLDLQRKWNVPHIVMFHTMSAVKKLFNVDNNDPPLRAEMEREIISKAHRIVASTTAEKCYMQQLYGADPGRVAVIPCGVNTDVFKPYDRQASRGKLGLRDDESVILFVGRLEPLKGIDRLLKGYSMVKDAAPATIIILGGDESNSDYKEELQRLALNLGINDRVCFMGSVPQDELYLYYSAANISIVSSYYESFCLVMLESLACGTPVITSDIGAARQIINSPIAGAVLDNNSPEKIAAKILEYLKIPGKTGNIELTRKSIADYNWNSICTQVVDEYSTLINIKKLCETSV